jgi:hypothetical protein
MATAPALVIVPANEVKIPEIKSATKLAVWKTPDGVYHDTVESLRIALTTEVVADMLRINSVEDVPTFIATHLERIKLAVDAAIKKVPDQR